MNADGVIQSNPDIQPIYVKNYDCYPLLSILKRN